MLALVLEDFHQLLAVEPQITNSISNPSARMLVIASEGRKASESVPESRKGQSHLKVEQSTRVNGSMDREMARANRNGLMGQDMRDSGKMAKPMDMESSTTRMVIFMKETGLTTRLTEMEHTLMLMEQSMSDSGAMTSSMALAWRLGLMVQSTKVLTTKERRMERAS